MAMSALRIPGPNDAVMAMANSTGGKAMVRSTKRISNASIQPPKKPATAPTSEPRTTENTMTTAEMGSEVRAPHRVRMNTSRPSRAHTPAR